MTLQGFFTWDRVRHWTGCLLFTLFFLAVMLDPTNTILGLKSKVFALLFAFNVVAYRPSFRFLPHIFAVYAAVTLSYMLSILQGNSPDFDTVMDVYVSFIPLLLLLWVHHYDLIRLSLFPATMIGLVVCAIFALSAYAEEFEGAIYLFMRQHNHTALMTHRYFLGIKVFGIYYKSTVCMIIPLFWYYHQLAGGRSPWRWLALVPAGILTFAFFTSGTRATMLLPLFLMVLVGYKRFAAMHTGKYILYPLLAGFATCFLLLIIVLASEKTEISNMVKYAHLTSYKDLFEQNPIYLVLGQGPGTRFYSQGFNHITLTTEWTYIELIRQYGLACLLILYMLLYPLYALWKHHSSNYIVGIMGAYFAYLMIAGTNPLLISSTGIQIVLVMYCLVTKADKNCNLPTSQVE